MQLYRSGMDGKDIDGDLIRSMTHLESTFQSAKALRDIGVVDSNVRLLVEWEGLPDRCDFTWEPLSLVHEDIPGMVQEFLAAPGSRSLKDKARQELEN